jgi:hypothetical protein
LTHRPGRNRGPVIKKEGFERPSKDTMTVSLGGLFVLELILINLSDLGRKSAQKIRITASKYIHATELIELNLDGYDYPSGGFFIFTGLMPIWLHETYYGKAPVDSTDGLGECENGHARWKHPAPKN